MQMSQWKRMKAGLVGVPERERTRWSLPGAKVAGGAESQQIMSARSHFKFGLEANF